MGAMTMSVRSRLLTIAAGLCALGWPGLTASAQPAPNQPAADGAQDAARQANLTDERWRQAQGKFEKWLAIQKIYSPAEVAALKAEMAARASELSPAELEKMLGDLESRLAVLLSPEADEAREWIGGILAVARNPEAHLGGPLPDVVNMSAEEIKAELERFQRRRGAQRRAQADFNQTRERQVQGARGMQGSPRGAPAGAPHRPAPLIGNAAPGTPPSIYAPWQPEPAPRRPPVYRIAPWGEPIYWDPFDYRRRLWEQGW
jgi:hypothetical protein